MTASTLALPTPRAPLDGTPGRDWDALGEAALARLRWDGLAEVALARLAAVPASARQDAASDASDQSARRVLPVVASLLTGATTTAAVVAFLALAVLPRTGAYSTLTVLSGSMAPRIPAGSVVVDTPLRVSDVRVGDVITFRAPTPGGPVTTHRVVAVEERGAGVLLRTQGDGNAAPDPWTLAFADPAGTTVHEARFAVPWLGHAISALRTPVARVALGHGAPAVLCLLLLVRIWRRP